LNVAPLSKPASGVETPPFGEHASHRVEGVDQSIVRILSIEDRVEVFQDRAIQKPQHSVGVRLTRRALVLRDRESGLLLKADERLVRRPQQFQVVTRNQIQTVSEIDDRAHDRRISIVSALRFPLRPFQSALWVRLPKVGARTEPIKISFTLQNIDIAADGLIGGRAIAAVVSEDE